MKSILRKKAHLAEQKVETLKLRNSKLVNPNDLEEEEENQLTEDRLAAKPADDPKRPLRAQETLEDLRSTQLEVLTSGKEALTKAVKKMPAPQQLRASLWLGVSFFWPLSCSSWSSSCSTSRTTALRRTGSTSTRTTSSRTYS